MNRVLWLLLVIGASFIAAILGATLAAALRSLSGTGPRVDTSRNAPKGCVAVAFWGCAGLGCGGLVLLFGISLVMILTQSPADPPPPDPPPRERPGENKLPPSEDLGPQEKQTLILGGVNDPTFKDVAPAGGLLIGFDIGLGQEFGVELVKTIRPIYRTPQGERQGRQFGTESTRRVTVRAKPGYAVGGLNVKAGLMVNGFSVEFMRVQGPRLDPNDSYPSPWFGDKTGGNGPILLTGNGTPIVGLIGKRSAADCMGIGLLKQ
jgi:hypothetical protein